MRGLIGTHRGFREAAVGRVGLFELGLGPEVSRGQNLNDFEVD